METKDTIVSWICLSLVPGLGPITAARLLERFGSPEGILSAPAHEIYSVQGIGRKIAACISNFNGMEEAEDIRKKCRDKGIKVIASGRMDYPENLRHIQDPPIILYCLGELLPEDKAAVAVVGTREPTEYGKLLASRIAAGLAEAGVTVVSGMARGIDSAAQQAAIENGGRTIAVLGSGVDVIYPREKKSLYKKLLEKGAVLSEYPLGARPSPENFPRRNRIISGLCLGTVVVQARKEKSGALITARLALEQGRQVYAVPGPAGHPDSRVTNAMIKQGARLVESAEDIIEDLLPQMPSLKKRDSAPGPLFETESLPPAERDIYLLIPGPESSPIHVDRLLKDARLDPGETTGILLSLELKGFVKQLPGKLFLRTGY